MIDMFDLWEKFIGAVNTQQGGSVKPNRNFVQWVHDISVSLYEEKFAAWGKSQKIIDDLARPFLTSVNIQVKDVPGANYGQLTFPENYGHYSSVGFYTKKDVGAPLPGLSLYTCDGKKYTETKCPDFLTNDLWDILKSEQEAQSKAEGRETPDLFEEHDVDKISNDRWRAMMAHRFSKATQKHPKVTDDNQGLKVAPAGVGIIVLDYLRKPVRPTFPLKSIPGNPVTGEGDDLIYDKATAVPLEWSELVINEFITRLEKKYGKYVREQFIYETAEADRKSNV